ncbi:MAG: 3-oxoacyl-ACP reductase FabG [Planctomycetota bacterium]|jgi:3-oxoacyl-[acyl-carrier protein] reductase|nr:3-oxoacyl-ACP reductase FabG [Planctomycetota bacterium]
MGFDFSGQTLLVSGGSRGIGRAVAEEFLAAGGKVLALYGHDEASAVRFQEEAGAGDRLRLEQLDVSDAAAVAAFGDRLLDQGEKVDVLVNSAGIRRDAVLAMLPQADWEQVLAVNLTGTFSLTKSILRLMSPARYGRIVNITSPSGKLGFAGQSNYAASKAGLVALTQSLAKEVAKRGITVNAVSPGFIDTDFIKDLPEAQAAEYRKQVPMGRFGTAREVAAAVLFLASREAAYITGATLEVTGGL